MFLPALTINNWINLEWSENVFLANTDTRITNPSLGLEKIDFVVWIRVLKLLHNASKISFNFETPHCFFN